MNQRPFIRKIVYLAIIVVLLVPLSLLSMPSRQAAGDQAAAAGGMLSRLRDKYKLGRANLGEIDPTSETMKLATLGMRGVAVMMLREKANEYRLHEDWTAYSATMRQITNLQPNFPTIWENETWNMAYNISYEFDDYRDRYAMVMEGVRFLQKGIKLNENSNRLVWYMGWVISHKIGRADEHLQFRRLFREDDDFHGTRPLEERDNWLVGREYFREAEAVAERTGASNVGPVNRQVLGSAARVGPKQSAESHLNNPMIFYLRAPMCRIEHAVAIEEEGVLDERAGVAWDIAGRDFKEYGAKQIRTVGDQRIRLNDLDPVSKDLESLIAQFDALPPTDRREKLLAEKRSKLTSAELEAVDKPAEKRAEPEAHLAAKAAPKLQMNYNELAELVDAPQRDEARRLAKVIGEREETLGAIRYWRDQTNYDSWIGRCEMERQAGALEARRLVNQAEKARADQDLLGAKKLYEEGFVKWAEVLDQYPNMKTNMIFGGDMMEFIKRYRTLIKRGLDLPFPDDFPLQYVIDSQPPSQ